MCLMGVLKNIIYTNITVDKYMFLSWTNTDCYYTNLYSCIDAYDLCFKEKNVSNLVDRNMKKGFQSWKCSLSTTLT